ncbi:MAG: WYL domain-containing transcriptional regulator [Deltaproteobacteria bacterium]|nr:WYL domain-containing transcriptional regulator [Deltaproteobacteria bacterium]
MPRNDQVTRQWLLLKRLEDVRGATLSELAESLPEDYSRHPRTIRRDLEALEAAHIPLITERRNGQTVWRLMDGYRQTLPLALSPTELMALVFSRDLLKPLDGTEIKASLDSALTKAAAALPAEGATYVENLRGQFAVGLGSHKTYREHRHTIDQLSRAISRTRTVQVRYYTASRNQTRRRDVDPYRLWYADGGLFLIGYCHLRRDVRTFAVDRIRSLAVTNRPCQMPLGFDLDAYVKDSLVVMRGKPIELELLFDKATTAWVKGRIWHHSQHVHETQDGRLVLSLRVADTPELVGWVLHFGGGVQVVGPAAFRDKVRDEARKILDRV